MSEEKQTSTSGPDAPALEPVTLGSLKDFAKAALGTPLQPHHVAVLDAIDKLPDMNIPLIGPRAPARQYATHRSTAPATNVITFASVREAMETLRGAFPGSGDLIQRLVRPNVYDFKISLDPQALVPTTTLDLDRPAHIVTANVGDEFEGHFGHISLRCGMGCVSSIKLLRASFFETQSIAEDRLWERLEHVCRHAGHTLVDRTTYERVQSLLDKRQRLQRAAIYGFWPFNEPPPPVPANFAKWRVLGLMPTVHNRGTLVWKHVTEGLVGNLGYQYRPGIRFQNDGMCCAGPYGALGPLAKWRMGDDNPHVIAIWADDLRDRDPERGVYYACSGIPSAVYRGSPSTTEAGEWDLFHLWGEDALGFLEEPTETISTLETPPMLDIPVPPSSALLAGLPGLMATINYKPRSIRERLDQGMDWGRPDMIILDDPVPPAEKRRRARFHVGASVVVKASYNPPRGKPSRPLAGLTGVVDDIDGVQITLRFADDPPNCYRCVSRRHLKLAPPVARP